MKKNLFLLFILLLVIFIVSACQDSMEIHNDPTEEASSSAGSNMYANSGGIRTGAGDQSLSE